MDLLSLAAINKASGNTAQANNRYQQAVGVLQGTGSSVPQDGAAKAVCELGRLFAAAERQERTAVQAQFHDLLITAQKKHAQSGSEDFHPVAANLLKTWQRYMDLGNRYFNEERTDQSEHAYRNFHEATKLAYRIFPHDHVSIAECLNMLGSTSTRLRMYDQADSHLQRAATIYSASPEHACQLACVKLNLAALSAEIFEYRQALLYLSEAAELLEKTASLTDSNAPQMYRSTLTMMTRAELYASAKEMIRQAIEAEESDHLEQARHLYDRTLVLLRRVFPEDHLEIAQVLHFKSNILRKLGDNLQATGLQREAEGIESRIDRAAQKWEQLISDLPPFKIPPSRTLSE
jgi:tetratricopeptide (TPR) repeat protein